MKQRLTEAETGAQPRLTKEPAAAFDWDELDRLLGEDELEPIEYERLAFALGRILRWLTGSRCGEAGSKKLDKVILTRLLALCWATNPELFEGRPSLRALARTHRINKSSLSYQAAKASADFGMQNREQIETRKRTKKLPRLTPKQLAQN
jgi:hypothetical protein